MFKRGVCTAPLLAPRDAQFFSLHMQTGTKFRHWTWMPYMYVCSLPNSLLFFKGLWRSCNSQLSSKSRSFQNLAASHSFKEESILSPKLDAALSCLRAKSQSIIHPLLNYGQFHHVILFLHLWSNFPSSASQSQVGNVTSIFLPVEDSNGALNVCLISVLMNDLFYTYPAVVQLTLAREVSLNWFKRRMANGTWQVRMAEVHTEPSHTSLTSYQWFILLQITLSHIKDSLPTAAEACGWA